jgi:hypothetical protein
MRAICALFEKHLPSIKIHNSVGARVVWSGWVGLYGRPRGGARPLDKRKLDAYRVDLYCCLPCLAL